MGIVSQLGKEGHLGPLNSRESDKPKQWSVTMDRGTIRLLASIARLGKTTKTRSEILLVGIRGPVSE
jgi:hypothetical protein